MSIQDEIATWSKEKIMSHVLVGCFFNRFAILEERINWSISALFRIDPVKTNLFGSNINLHAKINLLLSLANSDEDSSRGKKFTKIINRMKALNTERNIIAHNKFSDHDHAGLTFYYTNKESHIESVKTYSKYEFSTLIDKIDNCADDLVTHVHERYGVDVVVLRWATETALAQKYWIDLNDRGEN